MMKFYDLRVQGVPQALFILLLAASFGMRVLLQPYVTDLAIYQQQILNSLQSVLSQGSLTSPAVMNSLTEIILSEGYTLLISLMVKILGFIFLQQAIMMLLSFFYLGSYMVDLESSSSTLSQYFKKYFKALPRYIAFNILFYLCAGILFLIILVASSFVAMLLPLFSLVILLIPAVWFVVQVLFIFKDAVFLDTGAGVFKNFSLSLKLSSGNRIMIGRNVFFIFVLNWIIRMISTGNSVLISMFIFSFMEVIMLLIMQRLTALMYMDRTRVEKDDPKVIDRT